VDKSKQTVVRRLLRPNFEKWATGSWVDPDFLDKDLKLRLWELLDNRWAWTVKVDVLYEVGEHVQNAIAFFDATASANRVAQLVRIKEKSRELLQAFAALDQEVGLRLDSHITYLVLGSEPPERLSQFTAAARYESQILGQWWDVVQDVEIATAYAALKEKPSKNDRPVISNAKRLIYFSASAVHSVIGKLPPRGKGTWFPIFMRELGDFYKLKCGLDIVNSVVLDMSKQSQFNNQSPRAAHSRRHIFFKAPVQSPD
jgi:hypothetical protein